MHNHHQSFGLQGPHPPLNSTRESGQRPQRIRHPVKVSNFGRQFSEEQIRKCMQQHDDFQGMERIGDELFAYYGSQESALHAVHSLNGILGSAVRAERSGSVQAVSSAQSCIQSLAMDAIFAESSTAAPRTFQQEQPATSTSAFHSAPTRVQYPTSFPSSNIYSQPQMFPSQNQGYPTKEIQHQQLETNWAAKSTLSNFGSSQACMAPFPQPRDPSPNTLQLGAGTKVMVISPNGTLSIGEHAVILGASAVTGMWDIHVLRTGQRVLCPASALRPLSDSATGTGPRPQSQPAHSYPMPHIPPPVALPNNIYIKNLDVQVTHDTLLELFKPYGEIVDSRLLKDPSGLRKYAYLRYRTNAQAQAAIKSMHDKPILGKAITVVFHKPKSAFSRTQQLQQVQVQKGGIRSNCHYFANGRCQYGSSCRNIHDESLVRRPFPVPVGSRSTSTTGVVQNSDSADDAIDHDPEEDEVDEDEDIQLLQLELLIPFMSERAQRKGKKMWGRSKLMLVGEGQAGKSALANAIMDKEFVETESTVGISCTVHRAVVGNNKGNWSRHDAPEKEYEAAVASMVKNDTKEENKPDNNDMATVSTSGTGTPAPDFAYGSPPCIDTVTSGGADADQAATCQETVDNEVVMKYLGDDLLMASKYIISLFDFGGQSVFNVIHHLFLTRQGIYCVVFNMEMMVSRDDRMRERCLQSLKFWINSIVVHSYDNVTKKTAKIIFVGTRKDQDCVADPNTHADISRIIRDKFGNSLAWPEVCENRGENLCFFPVNNKLGRGDPTIKALLEAIEAELDDSDFVKEERPLAYYKFMDQCAGHKKSSWMTLEEATAVAVSSGVDEYDVPNMLKILHDAGVLMFHDEPGLRNFVVLDPIRFFVEPVSTVICKHTVTVHNTADDSIVHRQDVHIKCEKKWRYDFLRMMQYGIVTSQVLSFLLSQGFESRPTDVITQLMIKFGLLVELPVSDPQYYLVPALLPSHLNSVGNTFYREWITCHIFFATNNAVFSNISTICKSDVDDFGFLPSGLFERVVGKVVAWIKAVTPSISINNMMFLHDEVLVPIGSKSIRLKHRPELCTIEVNIEGSVRTIHKRLVEKVEMILNECMKGLYCTTVLPYPYPESRSCFTFADDYFLVPLTSIRSVVSEHSQLLGPRGVRLRDCNAVEDMYQDWLPMDNHDKYDVFLSYRWGPSDAPHDDQLVEEVYHQLGISNMEQGREIHVFWDRVSLKVGTQFQSEFSKKLMNSIVVVPVISHQALARMCDASRFNDVDSVIIEWSVALECYQQRDSSRVRVQRIYPIIIGERDNTGCLQKLFDSPHYRGLPDRVPSPSLNKAAELLQQHGLTPGPTFTQMTIKHIVDKLAQETLSQYASASVNQEICKCVNEVLKMLRETRNRPGDSGALLPATISAPTNSAHLHSAPIASADSDAKSVGCSEGTSVDGIECKAVTSVAPPPPSSAPVAKKTLKEITDEIKRQCGLGDDYPTAVTVMEGALIYLGDDSIRQHLSTIQNMTCQAEYLLKRILG